jgi:hypothetical protein
LATLAMMDAYLSGVVKRGKIKVMNLVQVQTVRQVQVEKEHVKNLNA